jgi:hypothetical protein
MYSPGIHSRERPFSQGEKVAAKRTDEGMPASRKDRNPSPGSFGATLSRRERVYANI